MKTIGIVGLGLIGGSFARAYKNPDGEAGSWNVLGFNRTRSIYELAHIMGAVDGELTRENMKDCECILITLHTIPACQWLKDNVPSIGRHTMVIDCCGVKQEICRLGFGLARQYGFTFVGGHPMAGTHQWGFKASRADLYKGASFVVIPPVYDDVMLLERVKSYVMPAGFGRITVTTADKHDRMIAFTSQLAHVVSNAYVKSPTAREHKGFSAGSYRDLTRVAWLNPTMWTDLFLENREPLLFELDHIITELAKYRDALAGSDEKALWNLLEEGRRRKEEVDG